MTTLELLKRLHGKDKCVVCIPRRVWESELRWHILRHKRYITHYYYKHGDFSGVGICLR